MVVHIPVKFSGQTNCSSGDIIALVRHVILQDHLSKGLRVE